MTANEYSPIRDSQEKKIYCLRTVTTRTGIIYDLALGFIELEVFSSFPLSRPDGFTVHACAGEWVGAPHRQTKSSRTIVANARSRCFALRAVQLKSHYKSMS